MVQAQAAWPDVAVKTAFLDKIDSTESEATEAELKAGLYSMFRPGQEEQHGQLADRILQSLPQVDTDRHQDFVEDYVDYILPGLCTNKSVERLADNIRDRGGLGLIATKALMVMHQEDQRCVEMAAKQSGGL